MNVEISGKIGADRSGVISTAAALNIKIRGGISMSENQPTRTCRACTLPKPFSELVKIKGKPQTICTRCAVDYKRARRRSMHVDPTRIDRYISRHSRELKARLIARRVPDPNTECWLWGGTKNGKGYGQLTLMVDGVEIVVKAHRLMMCVTTGHPISKKEVMACHKCDNPPCFNPDHLFPGTNGDNIRDAYQKGRVNHPKGSDMWNAKLSESDIPSIRERISTSESSESIARDYGVTGAAISNIRLGKAWRHA